MRSVPACCCLSSGTEHSSSRAPRRAARAAQSEMRTQEGVRAEARTVELRAVAQLGPAAARSPAPPFRRAPPHPAPPQRPARRRMELAPASPLIEELAAGVRHRAAAPRLREPYPVYARAPGAHAVWTAPKPALRAGARVAAAAPAPLQRGAQQRHHRRLYTSHCWSLEAPQSFLPLT